MSTRGFISALAFLLLVGVWGVNSAQAQKYTTGGNRVKPTSSSNQKADKCTINDARAIKKFDKKLRLAIEKTTLAKEKEEAVSQKEIGSAKRAIKDAEKAVKLFESEEYNQMKAVYQRCGKEMPTIKQEAPFWAPDELHSPGATCSDCEKE